MRITTMLILICLMAKTTLKAQNDRTELDSVLTILAANEMFHGQVVISEHGVVSFNKAYGTHKQQPITRNTPIAIESITKTFTAVAILMLAERDSLRLDDFITEYIPDLPYDSVSIKHLLTMTSGLSRFFATALEFSDTTQLMTNPKIIDLISKRKPLSNKPGVNFKYNNSNYLLLASIVEVASGQSYANFISKNILKPLGMRYTYVKTVEDIEAPITADNFYAPYGEGNIYSTAQDLLLFDQALSSSQLITPSSRALMFTPYKLANGQQSNYGFAWRIREVEEGKKVRTLGDGKNSRSIWERNETHNSSFIYLHINSVTYQEPIYQLIQNIINGLPYEIPIKREIHPIDVRLLRQYTGSYLSEMFGLLHITESNGKLYLRPDPVPGKEELVPSSDSTFFFANQPLEWEFFKNQKGKVIGLGFKGDRQNMGIKKD